MSDKPEAIGWCNECHGPVVPKTAWALVIEALLYDLWMALPISLAMGKLGFAILPYAGGHAFTCRCPSKVLGAKPRQ